MAGISGVFLAPLSGIIMVAAIAYSVKMNMTNLDKGVKKLLIGIGGSATNDGGAGVIQALGGKLLDQNGNELGFGGGELGKLHSIDLTNFNSRLIIKEQIGKDVLNAEGAGAAGGLGVGLMAFLDGTLKKGIDSIFGIMKDVTSIEEALAKGQENIEKTAENVIRLMNLK